LNRVAPSHSRFMGAAVVAVLSAAALEYLF
jgi:hypothetical protein